MHLIRYSVDCQYCFGKYIPFIVLCYHYPKQKKKSFDSPHVHLDFSGMAMVDRAEIEALEPFIKEKVQHQMTQVIIHTSTLY